jgi:hypothetical protein
MENGLQFVGSRFHFIISGNHLFRNHSAMCDARSATENSGCSPWRAADESASF